MKRPKFIFLLLLLLLLIQLGLLSYVELFVNPMNNGDKQPQQKKAQDIPRPDVHVIEMEKPNSGFTLSVPELPQRKVPNEVEVKRNYDIYFESFSRKRFANFSAELVDQEKRDWKHFNDQLKSLRSPPDLLRNKIRSRGIIISCGGKYYDSCMANLKILIQIQRVSIPIEVWFDDGELSSEQIQELEHLREVWGNPRRRTFNEVVPSYNLWLGSIASGETNIGSKNFHMKLMAIVGSAFLETLYLDADNTPLKSPEFLFDDPEFRKTGAIFWPDMYTIPESNKIWEVMDVAYRPTWAQESGQILIDKSRAWRALLLTAFLNQRQGFYYSLVNGDKDTFLMSWLASGSPFYMVSFPPIPAGEGDGNNFCGNSFIQSDTTGRPLFIHAVGAKSILKRKWKTASPYDPEKAAPLYHWARGCIMVDQNEDPGSSQIVTFHSMCGNIEEAIMFVSKRGDSSPASR